MGGPSYWDNVADLSVGGSYIETPIPLDPGTKFSIAIWIEQSKVIAQATIIHRTPGLGIGIRFHQLSNADQDIIGSFLGRVLLFSERQCVNQAGARESQSVRRRAVIVGLRYVSE